VNYRDYAIEEIKIIIKSQIYYPIVIIADRYSGGDSSFFAFGGDSSFFAFVGDKDHFPDELNGGDEEHWDFVEKHYDLIGQGVSPTLAYQHLQLLIGRIQRETINSNKD